MERGWDARDLILGLLAERRARGEPGTQEWLAEMTGITRVTINGYVTKTKKRRRALGMKNARRIAEALEVSPVELGAPEPAAGDVRGNSVLRRLQELEEAMEELGPELRRLVDRVEALELRVPAKSRRSGSSGGAR